MPLSFSRMYSTVSRSSSPSVASPCSSNTRSESTDEKCSQISKSPSRTGEPSLSPTTRHPPSSSTSISVVHYPLRLMATNRDYIRYEGVEKRQSYHLAESSDEPFDDEFVIRTCDMRSATFARDLGDALREIGFAIIDGHGVDAALYDEAEAKVLEMFGRLTLEEKMRFRAERYGSVNQGYFPIHETSKQHPDLVEGWVFCRRAFERPDEFWPYGEYAAFFEGIVRAHERLILPIMQSLLAYLG